MTDELRAALDRLTPEQRARLSKAMARAFVIAIEEAVKGGPHTEEGEERDEDPS